MAARVHFMTWSGAVLQSWYTQESLFSSLHSNLPLWDSLFHFLWKWIGQESQHSGGQRWPTSTCEAGTRGAQVSYSLQHDPLALTNSTMFHHLSPRVTTPNSSHNTLFSLNEEKTQSLPDLTSILGVSHSSLFSKFPKIKVTSNIWSSYNPLPHIAWTPKCVC